MADNQRVHMAQPTPDMQRQPDPQPDQRTITLHNGQVITFSSDVSTSLETIPIIDAARIWSDDLQDRKAVAEEVREASRNIGFFYLKNHVDNLSPSTLQIKDTLKCLSCSADCMSNLQGIDSKYAEATFAQAKRFFALPEEKKMEVYTGLVPGDYAGYHPMECYNRNGSKHRDLSEAFNWHYEPDEGSPSLTTTPTTLTSPPTSPPAPSLWPSPSALPGFRTALTAHQAQLLRLARRLTRVFALALHLPEAYFDDYTARPMAMMRILRYPPQARPAGEQNGIGAHTDVECFTIVTQQEEEDDDIVGGAGAEEAGGGGGLEVLLPPPRRGDSEEGPPAGSRWVHADPVPGALVVNIADCFMRQTNDFFVSTVHRVINNRSGHERYSAPFFFGFDRDMPLEPVPTCVSEQDPMRYPVMTGGEYYAFRANKVKGAIAPGGGQAVSG